MRSGIEITRPCKRRDRDNDLLRRECQIKLEGEITQLQYLYALTCTIDHTITHNSHMSSSYSNVNSDFIPDQSTLCCVCFQRREAKLLFYPCRHAWCCQQCSLQLRKTSNQCPICRATIEDCIQMRNSINCRTLTISSNIINQIK